MTPLNEPREPLPILPVSWTAQAYREAVIVRPAPIPGWAEIVRVPDCVTRALLKCPGER